MPNSLLKDQIIKKFGSEEIFKSEFVKNCVQNFGSGWTWLVKK